MQLPESTSRETIELSIVIPAHMSEGLLADTVAQLRSWWDTHKQSRCEVLIVENGSTDRTWEEAQALACADEHFCVKTMQSPKGLGNAYEAGILNATGQTILLTADDLPFDCTDLAAWERVRPQGGDVFLGSKAHPESAVDRGLVRACVTFSFRLWRSIFLGVKAKDSQGTIFLPRDWARNIGPRLEERGYLFSTALVYLAEQDGLTVVEMPVRLSDRHVAHATRVSIKSVLQMAAGLVSMRGRLKKILKQAHSEPLPSTVDEDICKPASTSHNIARPEPTKDDAGAPSRVSSP